MKKILYLLLLLPVLAFGQSPFYNDVVRANPLSSAKVSNALDVSKPLSSSGTNTYTFSAPFTGFTAYHTGDVYTLVFGNANSSTTVSANIATIGALSIKDASGSDLAIGDLKAGGAYKFYYNGTHLRMMGGSGGGSSVTPAALTKTDDTNVTLTLGGTPSTALLQAASITVGWTGTLGVARGGTNLSSYTAGDLPYASGSTTISKLGIGANKTFLTSSGSAPQWTAGATASEAITGTDDTKPLTSLSLEGKRSVKLVSFTNNATGSSTIDCGSKQEVTVYYNTTVTGNITIALSNDSNLEILDVIIPITGSNITITMPSTTRMSRYFEVSSGDGWYQSTKILQVSSIGTADLHEISFKRATTAPVFLLRYDGPSRN